MSTSRLTLNLVEGSVSFQFTPQAAKELQATLSALISNLKTTAAKAIPGSKANPQTPMEYQHTGDIF